jgi:FlaA1/EpsC-like NDP-sugar epimerase
MASSWTGKRVLVTGGAGFLGSFRAAQFPGLEAGDPQHARGRHW